jgi:dCMP deaminase
MIEIKQKFIDAYMDTAERFAQLSTATRLKVGSIIVKDNRIISIGYNGMPAGWSNDCEYKHYSLGNPNDYELKTRPEVLHAEENAIIKLAKSHESGDGAIMFMTHAPCINCARLIYGSGISQIIYRDTYRSQDGLDFLTKCGIPHKKWK